MTGTSRGNGKAVACGSVDGLDPRALTRDELLGWLNDHVDQCLGLSIRVEGGGVFVLAGRGELQHWSHETTNWASTGPRLDDIAGLYELDGWSLDVTELDASLAATLTLEGGGVERVEILLSEEVALEIVTAPD
jgi:hypothetical protein